MQSLNVIDTAIRNGIFQTFTRLLEGSPLEARLRSQESFTLFAPVDISFAYLPAETFDELLRAESQGILSDVLGYTWFRERSCSVNYAIFAKLQLFVAWNLLSTTPKN
jgi:uncharacterized surface protein with fasciclin (FAS1) repeats